MMKVMVSVYGLETRRSTRVGTVSVLVICIHISVHTPSR